MDKKQSDDFLQGFACGWCLVIDMLRNGGMERLPSDEGKGMVAFADASEGYFHSSGLGELLGPYQTREMREALLEMMLAEKSKRP